MHKFMPCPQRAYSLWETSIMQQVTTFYHNKCMTEARQSAIGADERDS